MYPTLRAAYEAHGSQPCAAACHGIIDPPGFAFMHYDGIGRWTNLDMSSPVDSTGSFTIPSAPEPTYTSGTGGPIQFVDAIDMIKKLSGRPEVTDCMTDMWLRYLNRRLECPGSAAQNSCSGPGDTASLVSARQAFLASSNDMREMLATLAVSNAFTTRLPSPGEDIQ
jgi:hypothetical protein